MHLLDEYGNWYPLTLLIKQFGKYNFEYFIVENANIEPATMKRSLDAKLKSN